MGHLLRGTALSSLPWERGYQTCPAVGLTTSNWHQTGAYSKDTHFLVEEVLVWLSTKRMQGQLRSFSWELDQRRQRWVGGAETARTPQGTKRAEESQKDLEARVSMSQTYAMASGKEQQAPSQQSHACLPSQSTGSVCGPAPWTRPAVCNVRQKQLRGSSLT